MDESTIPSFPTYADLTQTRGWSGAATKQVALGLDDTSVALAVDRYQEGALLGVGGMGKVMLAHDARIGRDVAVKQLRTDREVAPEERERFLREARVQGQLEHPAIVPVYDIDRRPDGTAFFTMRRVLGRTLYAILEDLRQGDLAARARYTQRELLTAFATICLTIDYAHSRGVIHRDLKPANLMLGDFGEVYVLDWGLARLVGETEKAAVEASARLSIPGELMGTPLYMAPEQMVDPGVGPAADVFALGAILFEILTLDRLRSPETLWLPANARTSERSPERGIAPELETICVRATETEATDRYPTPRALQEAVVRFLEGDRELAQRKALAVDHAGRAREALVRAAELGADYEQERGTAIREVVRALALDPANDENVATLGQLMSTPPRVMPESVTKEMVAAEQQLVQIGARYSIGASLMWFLFLPVVLAIGLREPAQATLVLIPVGLAAVMSFIASRSRFVPAWIQLAVIGLTMVGGAATSRMFGPLVMVPTLIATFTIVLQAHPSFRMRMATLGLGAIAMTLPAVLELAGVLSPSYLFEHGNVVIVPHMLALPGPAAVTLLLLVASLMMLSVPCLFISRLRTALNDAQTKLLLQSWLFRRLGEELTRS